MYRAIGGILLWCMAATAGQSLSGERIKVVSNVAARSKAAPWRVEIYLHDWTSTAPITTIAQLSAIGFQADLLTLNGATSLHTFSRWDESGSVCLFRIDSLPSKAAYLRFQRDPQAKTSYCEIWDKDGVLAHSSSHRYSSDSTYREDGVRVGIDSTGAICSFGFVRIHSSLVPLNSRPPVHRDDADRILEWKFDGNVRDSSGNNNHGSLELGSAGYTATPGQKNPTAKIKTMGAPSWSDWVSLRAGRPAQLDARASYSQADESASVTYAWEQTSGPTKLLWDNKQSATPTVRGSVFGTYSLRLTVRDMAGSQNVRELQVGAVATDDKGVVVHANPEADRLFGPMIAFGRNPWGAADDAHLRGSIVRNKLYGTTYAIPPEWTQPLAGTVSFDATSNVASASLATPVTADSMEIPLNRLDRLDLSTFPTIIGVEFPGYGGEEILICSASGNSLNVCYDGRGYNVSGARNWSAGRNVYQRKVLGNGTQFFTDFCPAGPGLAGRVAYAVGTVTVTPGSATLLGRGTAWDAANGVYSHLTIRIEGTHNGGNPFVFFSNLNAINNASQIAMSRSWPADADSGTFSYQLIQRGVRQFAPRWVRPDSSEGSAMYGTSACLSDAELYWNGGFEVVTGLQTDRQYSYMSQYWMTAAGNGSINFYDEVLANYALYYRSGWQPALDAARKVGDFWLGQPLISDGWLQHFPRNMSIAGVVAAAVLDGRSGNWPALRKLAAMGANASRTTCDDDLRETGYQMMWLALAALFDPIDTGNPSEPGQRSYWKAKLADTYARDERCKGSDNSFASGLYFNEGQFPRLQVTNGSDQVTGSGFTPSMCLRTASGTGFVTTNSAVFSSSSPIPAMPGGQIFLTGTRGGSPYAAGFEFRGSGDTVTLAVLWPGDSGGVRWLTVSDQNITTITPNRADARFGLAWACTFNSPTSLTLSRPWDGPTGSAFLYRANLVGRGQQPFIGGIKTLQMKYASLAAEGAVATGYAELAKDLAVWIAEIGYDPLTGGLHYGRGFPACEPTATPSGSGFTFRNLQCTYGTGNGERGAARALLAEAQNAMRILFEANPTNANRDLGDQFYANQWGNAFTQPGFLRNDGLPNIYATDGALSFGKWYGFQFGIGMAHQWPAVRVGGVAPPNLQTRQIPVSLSSAPGATKARVTVTQPCGAQSEFSCTEPTCQIQIELDRRQGAHWVDIEYLSANDVVLHRADQLIDP